MRNRLILLIIISLSGTLYGGSSGGSAGELLNFGAGARTLGMGRVGTGLCDDASAPYYNPAGIYQIDPREVLFMHSTLPMGTRYDYLSYIHSTERFGSFGISMVYVSVGGVEDRDINNNRIGEFGETEFVTMISYARSIWSFISLGMNYKVAYHSISHWNDFGQGLDLSTLILPNKPLSFGLMVKNLIKPTLTLRDSKDEYPLIIRSGVSYKTMQDRLIFCTDMSWSEDRGSLFFGGLEYQIHRFVDLRLGLDNNFSTYGVGISFPLPGYTLRTDYTFLHNYAGSGFYTSTHNFSLSLEFGGFRAKLHPDKYVFSPTSHGKDNILWIEKEIETRSKVRNWQILIRNTWGETVRTYEASGDFPTRLYWDGRDATGNLVQDGDYYYEVVVTDETGHSYISEGKLTTVKTKGPEGEIIFEEKLDTLEIKPDILIQFEEIEGPGEKPLEEEGQ